MYKVDVLAIGAHPDDVELGCGGTLAKLISDGKKVAIIDMTKGELGTRGTPETRFVEAKKAQDILGVSYRENLGMKDGFLQIDEDSKLKIVSVIRKYQPEIVFCNAPKDRHPDHAVASKLVTDACFLSGLPKLKNDVEAWRPKHVFHYIQWVNLEPDFVIDISNFMPIKLKACLAYETQFYQENTQQDTQQDVTPIATKNFLESITYRCQDQGRLVGVDYAEAFLTGKTLCLKNFEGLVV